MNAVVYFRVVDPQKAIIQVENYLMATSQLAQTTLRAVLSSADLDALLAIAEDERDDAVRDSAKAVARVERLRGEVDGVARSTTALATAELPHASTPLAEIDVELQSALPTRLFRS